jgi:hypothetical protein
MKRLVLALALAAAGCNGSQVVVEASLDGEPVAGLPVWLVPYDRAALLDSVVQELDQPEPVVPAELAAAIDSLRRREEGTQNDSLRLVLAGRRRALEARVDTLRVARRIWRDDVYATFDSLARAREATPGSGARNDTTDARGRARIPADEGRYWVWSAYVLPDATLEWNVPVTVRGDSAVVRLTRENARPRRFY